MANVLNRANPLDFRQSVNTPDFPVSEWIINPDLSAVGDLHRAFWKVNGDAVEAMSRGEQNDVISAAKTARTTGLVHEQDTALARVLLAKINALETKAGITPTTMDAAKAEARAKL